MSTIKYTFSFTAALLLISTAAFADIYSWVDDNGESHYSDTPTDGSEQVDLGPTNTFTPPPLPATPVAKPSDEDDDSDAEFKYNEFQISSPSQDQVQWNTGGVVPVSMTLSPRLKTGHTIRLMMDGKAVQGYQGRNLSYQMTDVERGTHSLQAAVVDQAGKQLAETQVVTFTVQQTAVVRRPRI